MGDWESSGKDAALSWLHCYCSAPSIRMKCDAVGIRVCDARGGVAVCGRGRARLHAVAVLFTLGCWEVHDSLDPCLLAHASCTHAHAQLPYACEGLPAELIQPLLSLVHLIV